MRRSPFVRGAARASEIAQLPALLAVRLGGWRGVDVALLGVAHDHRARADHVALAHRDAVAEGRVDADEAVVADRAVARDDDVGGDEAVVADRRVVADVVAAPEYAVVADADERL